MEVNLLIRNVSLFASGGIIQIVCMIIAGFSLIATIPVIVAMIFALEKLQINTNYDYIYLVPNVVVMLAIYAGMWFFVFKWLEKKRYSAILIVIGAIIINLLFLYSMVRNFGGLKPLFASWNNDGCGIIPAPFIFICILYSSILLPIYSFGLKRWGIIENKKNKLRTIFLFFSSLFLLLCLLIGMTFLFFYK
jgi:hypothetical protein